MKVSLASHSRPQQFRSRPRGPLLAQPRDVLPKPQFHTRRESEPVTINEILGESVHLNDMFPRNIVRTVHRITLQMLPPPPPLTRPPWPFTPHAQSCTRKVSARPYVLRRNKTLIFQTPTSLISFRTTFKGGLTR